MLNQSEIVYELATQRADEHAQLATASNARRQAHAASKSGRIRMFMGGALISTGRRVQGRNLPRYSALAAASGES
jgi:multidrug resistance efflux pump